MWVEFNGEKVFGDGPCDILQRVERTGSLRMAALEIRMSYSQVWQLIDDLEKKLGFPLLIKRTGGALGGGSELTEKGAALTSKVFSFSQGSGSDSAMSISKALCLEDIADSFLN